MSDKKPGFFDLPRDATCLHPQHNAPTGLYIPPGKGYRHVCPACGAAQTIIPSHVYLQRVGTSIHD